jgi:hypothetical protein
LFRSPIVTVVLVIVLILGALVAWAMLANSCRRQTDDAIIPVNTGMVVADDVLSDDTDSTTTQGEGGEGTEGTEGGAADPRFGPFELVVTPAEGTGPWTEVTVDGEGVFAGILSEQMTWQVTAGCEITTAQPGNLTVTRNNEAVALTIDDSNGSGSASLTVEEAPANE